MTIKIKRVYDAPERSDGMRILVDRLWPRGISKEKAKIDLWMKEIAPSTDLRKWFNLDAKKWDEFRKRYEAELRANPPAVEELKKLARKQKVTLLFAKKDAEHNHAQIIANLIEE